VGVQRVFNRRPYMAAAWHHLRVGSKPLLIAVTASLKDAFKARRRSRRLARSRQSVEQTAQLAPE